MTCTIAHTQVSPRHDDTVYIIGDLHGQFHDVQHILKQLKQPTDKTLFVFNGMSGDHTLDLGHPAHSVDIQQVTMSTVAAVL